MDAEVVKAIGMVAAAGLGAGASSWYGMRYRMNGLEGRMMDRFDGVRGDTTRIESKVDKINGEVVRHAVRLAVLEVRADQDS